MTFKLMCGIMDLQNYKSHPEKLGMTLVLKSVQKHR